MEASVSFGHISSFSIFKILVRNNHDLSPVKYVLLIFFYLLGQCFLFICLTVPPYPSFPKVK